MAKFRGERDAFGQPGMEPRWTQGCKEGIGTAYSADSRVWFTIWNGCITEVYYPTIDRPQVRDLQLLVTDGSALFHDEKRHLRSRAERSSPHALCYRLTNADPEGRYQIVKEVLAAPHLPCVLQHVQLEGDADFLSTLRMHVLCAPHLQGGGWGNNAYVMDVAGRQILTAEKEGTWLALAASVPFARLSCGYVGESDGWTDLSQHFEMRWEFDRALDGNVALTGELALGGRRDFTVAMAFGDGLHHAVTSLLQALGVPIEQHKNRYIEQWDRPCRKIEEYADFLECHVEAWTVTSEGTLHPDVAHHFIRIHPVTVQDRQPDEDPNRGTLAIANRPPGAPWAFPAKEIVDAGFLELVRYGIRTPDDPLIVDSLRVVDQELKVDTPVGPCGVHQAPSIGAGWKGLRPDSGGGRTIPVSRSEVPGSRDLEAESSARGR